MDKSNVKVIEVKLNTSLSLNGEDVPVPAGAKITISIPEVKIPISPTSIIDSITLVNSFDGNVTLDQHKEMGVVFARWVYSSVAGGFWDAVMEEYKKLLNGE